MYSELEASVGGTDLSYLTKFKTNTRTYNVTYRRLRITIVVVETAIRITHSGCVSLALLIQNAARMRRIMLLSVVSPALPHFSTSDEQRGTAVAQWLRCCATVGPRWHSG